MAERASKFDWTNITLMFEHFRKETVHLFVTSLPWTNAILRAHPTLIEFLSAKRTQTKATKVKVQPKSLEGAEASADFPVAFANTDQLLAKSIVVDLQEIFGKSIRAQQGRKNILEKVSQLLNEDPDAEARLKLVVNKRLLQAQQKTASKQQAKSARKRKESTDEQAEESERLRTEEEAATSAPDDLTTPAPEELLEEPVASTSAHTLDDDDEVASPMDANELAALAQESIARRFAEHPTGAYSFDSEILPSIENFIASSTHPFPIDPLLASSFEDMMHDAPSTTYLPLRRTDKRDRADSIGDGDSPRLKRYKQEDVYLNLDGMS